MMRHNKTTAQNMKYRVLWALAAFFIAVLASAVQSQGREITDMFGRKFSIPDRPQRVYSVSPPMTNLLYAIDPTMLAGLTVPVREWEKKYLDKRMQSLPVLGGWYGQGNTPNIEMILKVMPEIIVVQKFSSAFNSKTSETIMNTVPAPVVGVGLTTVFDYPEAILYLGRLLGREARAKELASYARKNISDVTTFSAGIPEKNKVSVYYAEGVDGLNTDCDTSMHTELINLAGGRNVHHCKDRDMFGMEKISFEQIMLYNPDVILVFEDTFYRSIFADSRWQQIKAVRNKRVYLIPNQPFNWFDRPPSFMRLLGAKWVASLLYPERFKVDMVKETQQFFKLFLRVNLTVEEARKLVQAQ
jgi:iron complex transport system substrate-binding protein